MMCHIKKESHRELVDHDACVYVYINNQLSTKIENRSKCDKEVTQ